jgi:hypothetical protein
MLASAPVTSKGVMLVAVPMTSGVTMEVNSVVGVTVTIVVDDD